MITFCAECSVNSLGSYASAIQHWYHCNGLGELPRGYLYKKVAKGLANLFGPMDKANPAFAFTLEMLVALHPLLDFSRVHDARVWCMALFSFFGLLRGGELVRIKYSHVVVVAGGLKIKVPFSKGNLTEVWVYLAARDDKLCPVRAYGSLLEFVRERPHHSAPLFGVSYETWNMEVKDAVRRLGLGPARFSTHSFRRGGTTALFMAGVPEAMIAAHGRWKSLAYRLYLQFIGNVQFMPTAALANH
jgi:integrase